MLTDEEALKLIERVRRHTPSADVVDLCDWALAQIIKRNTGTVEEAKSVVHEVTGDRREYMRDYMRKKRAKNDRPA